MSGIEPPKHSVTWRIMPASATFPPFSWLRSRLGSPGEACRRVTEGRRTRSSVALRSGGTGSSNPASSSGESAANSDRVRRDPLLSGWRVKLARPLPPLSNV